MNLWERILQFFGIKTNAMLNRLEDPRETLEAAYQKQLAALADARRGIADVLTSEKRLELEAHALYSSSQRFHLLAVEAARSGNDEAARRSLEREVFVEAQRERLGAQIAEIRAQRLALESMAEKIRMRVELFRTEKLAVGARFVAAQATTRAGETVTGLSQEMAAVAGMVERARERSLEAQARAAALAQMSESEDLPADVQIDSARLNARMAALQAEAALPKPQLPNTSIE